MELKNPTREQVKKVISTFQNALRLAEAKKAIPLVDMKQYGVDHTFQKPNCHGGWYLIGMGGYPSDYFAMGGLQLAADLGFKNMTELMFWAHSSPNIWGNSKGASLFASNQAFGIHHNDPIHLSVIIAHWGNVYNHLS